VPYYHETLKWSDGSVESDLPMQRLSELFNINHFVVSQVNPHAKLLAPMDRKASAPSVQTSPIARTLDHIADVSGETAKIVVNFCRDQSRSSVKHLASAMLLLSPLFPFFIPLQLLGKSIVPILTQKYTGDITIMPPMTLKGMLTILSNPSDEEYLGDVKRGEKTTWPHISRMRLHVAIEFLLDDCRQSCRRQLARLEQDLLEASQSPRQTNKSVAPSNSRPMGRAKLERGGIPTASVLNLNELEYTSMAANQTRTSTSRSRRGSSIENESAVMTVKPPRGKFDREASFFGLDAKLKLRVQSFAADLDHLAEQVEAERNGENGAGALDDHEEAGEQ